MQAQEKIPGLQIARALAALTIAYDHSWHVTMPFPPGTSYQIPFAERFPSVPLFFAISGFVICLITTKPEFRPLDFLTRRAFRLYPLWIITSLAFLYLSLKALGLSERATPKFIVYSMTLLPTEGYPFYDLGWSLQHEIAFYALAALLVPRFGLAFLAALLCVGIAANHFWELPWYLNQYADYYPYFLAGIAVFTLRHLLKPFGCLIPLAIGSVLIIIFAAFGRVGFPLALFTFLTGFVNVPANEKSALQRAGVQLGDASYSIYLIHPLVFYFVYTKLQPPLPPIWSQEFLRFGSIALVCALAIVSWKFFESPAIRVGNWLIRRSMTRRQSLDNPQDVVANDGRLASREG
jgi:exopolysaccharide production protein ExoZ